MSLLLSGPLGMVFGVVTWAALRGRGGLTGLFFFSFFGALGALAGSFGTHAALGNPSDVLLTLGAFAGAALSTLAEVVGFGRSPQTDIPLGRARAHLGAR
jgi:hypothetical protein